MSNRALLVRTCAGVFLLSLVLPGCGGGGNSQPTTALYIGGNVHLLVGTTSQLTARTVDETDSGYTWSSSTPSCAQVDSAGLVLGVGPGTAVIEAVGIDSGEKAEVVVVVEAWEETDLSGLPYYEAWSRSAHGDGSSLAFHYWDTTGSIPTECARCHGAVGFRDYVGADGSAPGVVDAPAATGSLIDCTACHNEQAFELDEVSFPSGARIVRLGSEALCTQCHQTHNSMLQVDAGIAAAAPAHDDAPTPGLAFIGPHHLGAGTVREGTLVQGGYEYTGKRYDARFTRIPNHTRCVDCHDNHSLAVDYTVCQACHPGVASQEGARSIRQQASLARDYDGDGNLEEGIYQEVGGLSARLRDALVAYAADVAGAPLAISHETWPYYFRDLDGDGAADPGETTESNAYDQWTPRLVRAAYNYRFVLGDRGAYAHNAKYVIQLLHDSLQDLNAALPEPASLAALDRNDPGHFDGSRRAFRQWDDVGTTPEECTRCHGGGALADDPYVPIPGNAISGATYDGDRPLPNGLACTRCHSTFDTYALRTITEVGFPGGTTIRLGTDTTAFPEDQSSFLCLECHAGRAGMAAVDAAIASGATTLPDVHSMASAGVLFGGQVRLGYEYPGREYAGAWTHAAGSSCSNCHSTPHSWFRVPDEVSWWEHSRGANGSQCVVCHQPGATKHTFEVADAMESCGSCHFQYDPVNDVLVPPATPHDIRVRHTADHDGDGDTDEGLAGEIDTLAADLYARLRTVAAALGSPLVYDPDVPPYFFQDTDGDGTLDPDEANASNVFTAWTPTLLKASHNLQVPTREPGAWAHNFAYTAQLLIDAIEDLGGDVSGYVRP